MAEMSERSLSTAEQKQRIRERYKGVDESKIEIIPAAPQEDFFHSEVHKRVAVYARVSTDDPRQTSSYELQRNHYTDFVNQHINWELVDIYADEGISGTSLLHRDAFKRMISDCKAGKIDLIVTKSVSRFARNIIDCIGYVRELKALTPPVEVFFETENIHTLNSNSEMSLSFIATLAQEESHTKSEIMNASVQMRFNRGIFLTPVLLGYDKDEYGNLVVNEEEAVIVRLIFYMYLFGYSPKEIADTLTEHGSKTKKGNTTWSTSSILQILQNERHCGDVLAHKTWTPNYLDHKSKKNNGERAKVYQRDHHDPIISHEVFTAVQKMIRGSKYGGRGILPELHVIEEGILSGYVIVNPRWAAFKAEDYRAAYKSILGDVTILPSSFQVEGQKGDFDLRGFEVARSQFFSTKGQLLITFSYSQIVFSTPAVKKLNRIYEIELLVHPEKKMIAIRPSPAGSRNKIKWARSTAKGIHGRTVSGGAFIPALFELFGWKPECKYQLIGTFLENEKGNLILFDIQDSVVLVNPETIPNRLDSITPITQRGKRIAAYPAAWASTFGDEFYIQSNSESANPPEESWDPQAVGSIYRDPQLQIAAASNIEQDITALLQQLESKENTNA